MERTVAAICLGAVWAFSPLSPAKEDKKESSQSTDNVVATAEHKMVAPSDIKWADGPPSLPPGAKFAVLEGDPAKAGPFTVRLQFPAGYKIPAHTHPTDERVTVISGTFNMGMSDKFAWATGEATVQVQSTGPFVINYVNPADDPRKAKK